MSVLRASFFIILLLCAPALANAACPGTPSNCPSPTYNNLTVGGTATFNGTLTGTGLNALFSAPAIIGSVTPNAGHFTTLSTTGQTTFGSVQWIYAALPAAPAAADTALAAAITQCATLGTRLIIPQGVYVLDGSHAPNLLRNCAIEGSWVPGMLFGASSPGTLIELTSTSVSPFILGGNWSIRGINFYWPTQSGSTFYPPLFSDVTSPQTGPGIFEGNSVVNAYDIFKQTSVGWGNIKITNNDLFAVHTAWILNSTGDGISSTSNRYTPNIWLSFGGSTSAIGHAAQNSTTFDVKSGGTVNMNSTSDVFVGWQYSLRIESGGLWAESQITGATWDAVGTLIDTSAGGTYSAGNVFQGQLAAGGLSGNVWGVGSLTGNQPVFNMGSTGQLAITGFQSSGTQGSLVETAGTDITIVASESLNIGSALDGGDYYQIHATAGTPNIRAQDNRLIGINASAKTHGITASAVTLASLQIQNNLFFALNDDINIHTATNFTSVTGNTSAFTQAAGGLKSFNTTGAGAIMYDSNNFDSSPPTSPTATISAGTCTVAGDLTGTIAVGGGGPTTACTLVLPFAPIGSGAGDCVFSAYAAVAVGGASTGSTPPHWSLTFADLHGSAITYHCRGG